MSSLYQELKKISSVLLPCQGLTAFDIHHFALSVQLRSLNMKFRTHFSSAISFSKGSLKCFKLSPHDSLLISNLHMNLSIMRRLIIHIYRAQYGLWPVFETKSTTYQLIAKRDFNAPIYSGVYANLRSALSLLSESSVASNLTCLNSQALFEISVQILSLWVIWFLSATFQTFAVQAYQPLASFQSEETAIIRKYSSRSIWSSQLHLMNSSLSASSANRVSTSDCQNSIEAGSEQKTSPLSKWSFKSSWSPFSSAFTSGSMFLMNLAQFFQPLGICQYLFQSFGSLDSFLSKASSNSKSWSSMRYSLLLQPFFVPPYTIKSWHFLRSLSIQSLFLRSLSYLSKVSTMYNPEAQSFPLLSLLVTSSTKSYLIRATSASFLVTRNSLKSPSNRYFFNFGSFSSIYVVSIFQAEIQSIFWP